MDLHKLVFSKLFEQLGLVTNYLDVGARGNVGEPWSHFKRGALKVIGFEPDSEEAARLATENPDWRYYPHALWGGEARREFYLCEWASTSSMYPPDVEANKQYLPKHWKGRHPQRVLEVDCVSLDEVLRDEDSPDFIKIDTQGAEYEILNGAVNLLKNGAPLVLTETWCAEVYKGAPMTHEIMAFMHGLGYQVFDLNIAAAWQHQTKTLPDSHCKAKTIGLDLLFIKRLEFCKFASVEKLLKFAALCELYGFRDYAIAVLEQSEHKDALIGKAIDEMLTNERWERSYSRKFQRFIGKIIRRNTGLWPKLH